MNFKIENIDDINKNYNFLINTEVSKKLLLSERYVLLPELNGFIKNTNDVVLFNSAELIKNYDYYSNKWSKIRLYRQLESDLLNLKNAGIKYTSSKVIHTIKKITKEYLEFRGKKYRVERWNANKYDKSNFEVLDEPKEWDDVFGLLDFWDTKKRESGTKMTFTGHDFSFFRRFYKDLKEKYNLLTYYFYDNGKLIAFQVMEKVYRNFWILHTRKTDRFNYSNLNLYIDIYTFRNIMNIYGEDVFVEMGYEMGKPTEYKEKRFPTYGYVDVCNLNVLVRDVRTKRLF